MDRVKLYRAVDVVELRNIRLTACFEKSPNGTEYKGFFFSEESARSFALQELAMGGSEHTIVTATAPASLIAKSPPHTAATEGAGVLIRNDDLGLVKIRD